MTKHKAENIQIYDVPLIAHYYIVDIPDINIAATV